MKIIEFHVRITKLMKNLKIPLENPEIHERHIIQFDNNENHENHKIHCKN